MTSFEILTRSHPGGSPNQQFQPMRDKRGEIVGVHGSELGPCENGGGGDHGVEPGAAFAAGLEKQITCEGGSSFIKGDNAAGEDGLENGDVVAVTWFGMELRPCDRGTAESS